MANKPPKAPWDPASVPGAPIPKPPPSARGASGEVEVTSKVGIPRVDSLGPAEPPFPPPPVAEPRTVADEKVAFWGLSTDSQPSVVGPDPVVPDYDDALLSGGDELFDPATGWDYSAVSGHQGTANDLLGSHPALAAVSHAGMATVSHAEIPTVGEGLGALASEERTLAPDTADLPHLPTFKTSGRWRKQPNASGPPILEEPAPLRSLEPKAEEPDEPTEATVKVSFDDDGFFSLADVPAPTSDAADAFIQEESVYEIGPIDDSIADVSSPVVRVESTGEFEFQIDESSPDLGDQIFSEAAIPSLSPELFSLPTDDAIKKAQQLFQDGDADMGMALLEAALMKAPNDDRLGTWLEYGERRLISAYCPAGRPERVPVLRHPRERLLAVTAGNQRDLIAVIDGRATVSSLRRKVPHVPVVSFWKELGKLTQRGWLGWAD